jgi:hypothetical protein
LATFVVVARIPGQIHEGADFLERQIVGLLVQGFDEFTGGGGSALGFQFVMDGETHIISFG